LLRLFWQVRPAHGQISPASLSVHMARRAVRPADPNDLCLKLAAANGLGARPMPSAAADRPQVATGGLAAILRLTIGPMLV